jgi:hypothetical protein
MIGGVVGTYASVNSQNQGTSHRTLPASSVQDPPRLVHAVPMQLQRGAEQEEGVRQCGVAPSDFTTAMQMALDGHGTALQ